MDCTTFRLVRDPALSLHLRLMMFTEENHKETPATSEKMEVDDDEDEDRKTTIRMCKTGNYGNRKTAIQIQCNYSNRKTTIIKCKSGDHSNRLATLK